MANIQKHNPEAIAKKVWSNVPQKISEIQGDQINVLAKRDPDTVNGVLSVLLNTVMNKPNPMLVGYVASQIKSKYFYFRLSEIGMVLQRGITGVYGNVPGGANPVLYWCEKYDQERTEFYEAENLKHKETYEKYDEELKQTAKRDKFKKLNAEMDRLEVQKRAKEIVNKKS